MKNIILMLLISVTFTVKAQDPRAPISYVSINHDTILLIDNDTGRLILKVWENTKNVKKPYILLTDIKTINERRRQHYAYIIKHIIK